MPRNGSILRVDDGNTVHGKEWVGGVHSQTGSGAITITPNSTLAGGAPDSFIIIMNGNVTGVTIGTAEYTGQVITITFVQDATGGRTYVWPTSIKWELGAPMPVTAANAIQSAMFVWNGTNWLELSPSIPAAPRWTLPTNAIAETVPRNLAGAATAAPLTGRLQMVGIPLLAGQVVNSITMLNGNTASASTTNRFWALYSAARARLAISANDATVWAANTAKTLAMTAAYTVLASGLYYVAFMETSTTMPIPLAASSSATTMGVAPILHGSSNTGLTTTLPDPANALTAIGNTPYAYIS